MRHDDSTVVLGSVSPLIFTNLVAGTYQFTARRSIPCLAVVAAFRVAVLARLIRSRQSLTGEFTVDVNLTSCGALEAAITAALAADLGLDIFAISVSLTGCSDGRSLSVFRRLAFTVLEVSTAASTLLKISPVLF